MATTTPQAALALRNILIASDFSPCSENALFHAVSVAHYFDSCLHFAYVVTPTAFAMVPPDAYMGTIQAQDYAVELARADARKKVADVLRRSHCEDLKSKVWVSLGTVGDCLRGIISREHIDLAVVGTHGRTGLRKFMSGSVAEDVFRNVTCPVLTIGPRCWRANPQRIHIDRILFPTDLSPESAQALPLMQLIASKFNANATLLHVVERLDPEAAHDRARVVTALDDRLRSLAKDAGLDQSRMEVEVAFGNIAECVLETASLKKADLVVFGLKAPKKHEDELPWKHAYKVICEIGCPVLSLRGNAK